MLSEALEYIVMVTTVSCDYCFQARELEKIMGEESSKGQELR